MNDYRIPPVIDSRTQSVTPRQYKTELSSDDYLELEKQAVCRGLKPYGFTRIIMSMYLNDKLLDVSQLPENFVDQIKLKIEEYMKTKKSY